MNDDVPGSKPDPSLGSQPRARAPTARLRGAPRPANPVRPESKRLASVEVQTACHGTAGRRSRNDRDIPEEHPTPASCRECTGITGDRVHRGEPLLLGVDKEYQITYRL